MAEIRDYGSSFAAYPARAGFGGKSAEPRKAAVDKAPVRTIIARAIRSVERTFFLTSRNIYVVDDDQDVRSSISFMLGASGMASKAFRDGEAFVEEVEGLEPGCILLDVRMPRMDGFQVMAALGEANIDWPIIVMTGHGEIPVAVRAMKLGAVDFIEKPFSEDLLMSSLERAFLLLKDRGTKAESKRLAKERIERITPREREVLQGLIAGYSNRLLAERMGLSLRTVEMHRANMMDRLQVGSLAEALTLAVLAEVKPLETSGSQPE